MSKEKTDNPSEGLRRQIAEATASIVQASRDTGAAFAYRYHGSDDVTAALVDQLHVYAMVRPAKGIATLQQIDYFVPAIMMDAAVAQTMLQQGFVPAGYIDNHRTDVFGLCAPRQDDAFDVYAESLVSARYGRIPAITSDQALDRMQEWKRDKQGEWAVSKDDITRDLLVYRARLDHYMKSAQETKAQLN